MWIASKGDAHYLFPSYHGFPLTMRDNYSYLLSLYFEYEQNGAKIITGIKKLAKIYLFARDDYGGKSKAWLPKDKLKGILELDYPDLPEQGKKFLAVVNKWLSLPPKFKREYRLKQMCLQLGLSIDLYALNVHNFGSGAAPKDMQVLKPLKQTDKNDYINFVLCSIDGTDGEFFAIPFRETAVFNFLVGTFRVRKMYTGFDKPIPRELAFEKIYLPARIKMVQVQSHGRENYDVVQTIVEGYLKLRGIETPQEALPAPPEPVTYEQILGRMEPIAEDIPQYADLVEALNRGLAQTGGFGYLITEDGEDNMLKPLWRSIDQYGGVKIEGINSVSAEYISEIRDYNAKLLWKKSATSASPTPASGKPLSPAAPLGKIELVVSLQNPAKDSFGENENIIINAVLNNYAVPPEGVRLSLWRIATAAEIPLRLFASMNSKSVSIRFAASVLGAGTHRIAAKILDLFPGSPDPDLRSNIIVIKVI